MRQNEDAAPPCEDGVIESEKEQLEHERAEEGDPGLLLDSLFDKRGIWEWILLFAILAGALLVVGLLLALVSGSSPAVQLPVWLLFFGAIIYVLFFGGRSIARFRLRRLQQVRYGFDLDEYVRLLSRAYTGAATLQLRIVFSGPWPSESQSATLVTVRKRVRELEEARWEGENALWLESTGLRTTAVWDDSRAGHITANCYLSFTNAAIHRCFRGILRRVLPMLDKTVPIERIEVAIRGTVVPPDMRRSKPLD